MSECVHLASDGGGGVARREGGEDPTHLQLQALLILLLKFQ